MRGLQTVCAVWWFCGAHRLSVFLAVPFLRTFLRNEELNASFLFNVKNQYRLIL